MSEVEPVRLTKPLSCWHESLVSARTDLMTGLSLQGGLIATTRTVPAGTSLFLSLDLGEGRKAEIDAIAVASDTDEGFVVRFLALDEFAAQVIAHKLEDITAPIKKQDLPPLKSHEVWAQEFAEGATQTDVWAQKLHADHPSVAAEPPDAHPTDPGVEIEARPSDVGPVTRIRIPATSLDLPADDAVDLKLSTSTSLPPSPTLKALDALFNDVPAEVPAPASGLPAPGGSAEGNPWRTASFSHVPSTQVLGSQHTALRSDERAHPGGVDAFGVEATDPTGTEEPSMTLEASDIVEIHVNTTSEEQAAREQAAAAKPDKEEVKAEDDTALAARPLFPISDFTLLLDDALPSQPPVPVPGVTEVLVKEALVPSGDGGEPEMPGPNDLPKSALVDVPPTGLARTTLVPEESDATDPTMPKRTTNPFLAAWTTPAPEPPALSPTPPTRTLLFAAVPMPPASPVMALSPLLQNEAPPLAESITPIDDVAFRPAEVPARGAPHDPASWEVQQDEDLPLVVGGDLPKRSTVVDVDPDPRDWVVGEPGKPEND